MEIIGSYIVDYEESQLDNKLAILYYCKGGQYYIQYLEDDGLGWSMVLKKIEKTKAQELIVI